jgi:Na+-translocating ferredoxin:NAD+ oxidoreductase RnfD subunit
MPGNDPLAVALPGGAGFDVTRSMRLALLAGLPGALALLGFNGWGVPLQILIAVASALACEALLRASAGQRPAALASAGCAR